MISDCEVLQQNEARLDRVAIDQYTWKNATITKIAMRILKCAIKEGIVSPEDIDVTDVPKVSLNCVGTAFRILVRYKMIEKTGQFHSSTRKSSGGRTVFQYRLVSLKLAQSLLRRNGESICENSQPELGLFP